MTSPTQVMASPWKRRMVVSGLYALAGGLLVGYFAAARPKMTDGALRVDAQIGALAKEKLDDQRKLLAEDFSRYRRDVFVGELMLLAAFTIGAAATTIGGVWSIIELKRKIASI